jgi:MFS family permease
MTGYQWTVLLAAWLGWGFDIFDSILFNFVGPTCVPLLLHLKPGTPEAVKNTSIYVGLLTSLLLFGWGIGGVVFGKVADKIGRTKTLLLTMLLYSLGTAACAFAPNIFFLGLFRFISSLGVGGEWAAGAAMVAEVVPERRRVEAGVLLYTSAPAGIFLAILADKFATQLFHPETAWRAVFLTGLIPVAVALLVRVFVKEPERWKATAENAHPTIGELLTPRYRKYTFSGFAMATCAMLAWWTSNAFLPTLATGLGKQQAQLAGLSGDAAAAFANGFKFQATALFTIGGLIGVLLTIPIAKYLGRRPMFAIYFGLGTLAYVATYGLPWSPLGRLYMVFTAGLTIFGIFGAFTFYLPELFPTRLRGTGAGFCYNAGRFVTALGPVLVGQVGKDLPLMLKVLTCTAIFPALGFLLLPLVVETRGRELED